MATAKTKLVAASVAGVMLVGVTGTIAYQQLRTPSGKSRQVRVDPAATSRPPQQQPGVTERFTFERLVPATNGAWRTRFDQLYLLAPTETMKRVHRPFVPERLNFYQVAASPSQVESIPTGPDVMLLSQQDGPRGPQLTSQSMTFGGSEDVRSVLRTLVGVAPHETDLPRALLNRDLPGDFVVRASAPVADRVAAFTQLLSQELRRTYRSELRELEREVIVVRGEYKYHATPGVEPEGQGRGETVYFYIGTPQKKPTGYGGAGGGFKAVFANLEDLTGRAVIVETKLPARGPGAYRAHNSVQPFHRQEMDAASLDLLLENVAKQTSFELRREKRVLPTWVFTAAQ